MNQFKFSLADVITAISSVVFAYFCFLGINFYTLGSLPKSIGYSVLIALLLFGTAYSAKLLKQTSSNFKTRFILEISCLVFLTILVVFFTYMPFSHYFSVSAKKEKIITKLQSKITQAENMFPAYEEYAERRQNLYKGKLKSIVQSQFGNSDFSKYGFVNGVSTEIQITKKMENLKASLFPSNYSDPKTQKGIKEVATSWLLKAKEATDYWKPVGLTSVVVEIENNSNEWKSLLIQISQNLVIGESPNDFAYDMTFDDLKKYFEQVEKPTNTSWLLSLLTWILLILSWIVTKRHSRFPGIKVLFGSSQTSNNRL